jgi:ElaB/YqjD/DUF883 family membrane-anchored ribosome-binding protein
MRGLTATSDADVTCTMSTFALPADLARLVSELEHVLALNGHRAHQHAKYITEELQAKARSAAAL